MTTSNVLIPSSNIMNVSCRLAAVYQKVQADLTYIYDTRSVCINDIKNCIKQTFSHIFQGSKVRESKKKNRIEADLHTGVKLHIFTCIYERKFSCALKILLSYSILPQCETLYSLHLTQHKSPVVCKYLKLSVTRFLFCNFHKQVSFVFFVIGFVFASCLIGLTIAFQIFNLYKLMRRLLQ